MEQRLIPEQYRFLSGSALKLIAAVTMIIDHVAVSFLYNSMIVLFSAGSYRLTLYNLMRAIGRLSFPLFAFLLVEGFLHTHDKKRYGLRLAIFALLSELPWNLVHTGGLFYGKQNVFFTLLTGYLALCAVERFRGNVFMQCVCVFGLLIGSISVSEGFGTEIGATGVGKATQRAVIASFLAILIFGYMITRICYR